MQEHLPPTIENFLNQPEPVKILLCTLAAFPHHVLHDLVKAISELPDNDFEDAKETVNELGWIILTGGGSAQQMELTPEVRTVIRQAQIQTQKP